MTTPRPEDDVEAPLRLQPVMARPQGWRGRSNSMVAVGLVGFIVIGIVLGTAFDGGGTSSSGAVAAASPAPVSSSALPTKRPTPTRVPLATPLPTREIVGGQIPTERRLVYANGLQVLDLATGTLASPARPFADLMLSLSDGQLVCACMVRGVPGGDAITPSPILRFGRFYVTGTPIVERDLLTFDGVVPVPDMTDGYNVVAALDPAQRNLYVLAVIRRPPVWTVELHQVDIETGALVRSTVLDGFPVDLEEPSPSASARPPGSPPDGVNAWANSMTVSPDGGTVFASMVLNEVRSENWTSEYREWMIPVHDGLHGTPTPLSQAARLKPNGWCVSQPRFLDPDLLVQVCTPPGGEPPGTMYYVRQVSTSGESRGELPIPGDNGGGYYPATPMLDPERGAVFVWEILRHTLTRVSVADGQIDEGAVPQSMLPGNRGPGGGGVTGADPGLVASPDGRRLYALGFRSGEGRVGTSTGVWVFDADTLTVLDRWEPRALLTSLAVSADGRFVYAAGASGVDVDGRQNPWPASVTVYDGISGEIQVLYGALGHDIWISFPTWP
ncbi:MAG: hypothetical protein Q7S35_11565 [Candidatus Limnocylindrales bacterium]|nr:hypothetical protein [Candidatus Limnocylindrales bacterium]